MHKITFALLALSILHPITAMNKMSQKKLDLKFMRAARDSKIDLALTLLEKRANPNARVHPGTTALHECVVRRNIEACTFLVEHGAMPTIRNRHDETPLAHAASSQNEPLCNLLVERQKVYDKGIILALLYLRTNENPFAELIYANRDMFLIPYLKDHTLRALLEAHDCYDDKTAYDEFPLACLRPFGMQSEEKDEEMPE